MNNGYAKARLTRLKKEIESPSSSTNTTTPKQQKHSIGFPTKIKEDSVVEFFNINNQLDYTVTEISNGLGFKYNSIKYHIQKMADSGELVRVREIGNGWTYQLKEWFDTKKQEEAKRLASS